jgi:4-amino-4-deoxy-L-arabinose transferase-like glycosyltransferase
MAVDWTAASSRPYVAGSTNNSEVNLALAYNGVDRLAAPARGSNTAGAATPPAPIDAIARVGKAALVPHRWKRLFVTPFAPQISWWFFFAACGLVVASVGLWRRAAHRSEYGPLIFWGAWALAHVAVFSTATTLGHVYYTAALAPALAALAGIGLVPVARLCVDAGRRRRTPGVLALAAGLAWDIFILYDGPRWNTWLIPTITCAVAVGLLLIFCAPNERAPRLHAARPIGNIGMALAFAGLILAPAVWAASPLWIATPGDGGDPHAGPLSPAVAHLVKSSQHPAYPSDALVEFLATNRGTSAFLVATLEVSDAAPLILRTGAPVMAIGGFTGRDPVPLPAQLGALIRDGGLRFVLADQKIHPGRGTVLGTDLALIKSRCRPALEESWRSPPPRLGERLLYDCR